ncbi:MAG: isopenicillin N synthase family oxygenase [Deltaproteobacteria bacterium]|nr:isopenicillin N synthase family oxygenase [Deltaproteobacteria bacterium]MBW2387058.1 isopenicillin N synthase family oxygenase [Deltaproteobacteria bacterium]MBW2723963.1 isopenicillin N synthase family oxygenase [Deltaproteobacteria bacterium]
MISIPKLDLGDFYSQDAALHERFNRDLRNALTQFGFVRVVGHRIDDELIRRVYELYEQFFASPEPEKSKYASGAGGQRGFTAFGIEHARDQSEPDRKEFYHVGRELDPDHPLRAQYPDNVWPEHTPELREASLTLYNALDACAHALLESLALAFQLPRETFSRMLCDGNSILRALHYPPLPPLESAAPPPHDHVDLRAAPHEDINLITLLCEATDAGLEILTHEGRWLAVPDHPGEIIVDAGDMLSRVTNDVIPATTHRVVSSRVTRGRHRYSLPYFAHPYPSCDLSVHEAFVAPGTGAKYPPITAAAFLHERLKEIGLIA